MLFMLEEVMSPREACDRWDVSLDSLRMKLKHSDKVPGLIKEGKLKYYKPEWKKRGEWILTVEAMNELFQKKRPGSF